MNQVLRKPTCSWEGRQHSVAAQAKITRSFGWWRKSIRKRIGNKQWTYCSSFMFKTWFYSLVPLFWFCCFLIRNFNSFCYSFYYCNWPENSHHHAYSRHHANKEWFIFPTTTLIPGTTLIKSGPSFPPPRRETRLFAREEYLY